MLMDARKSGDGTVSGLGPLAKSFETKPGSAAVPRLVVVSNRVGVPDGNARAGGLEVAIRPTLRRRGGLWFGWSGRVADEPGAAKTTEKDATSYITIDLKKDDHDEFYNGFANRVLWPILHYRLDLAEFTRRDLSGYFRVNDYFASHLETLLKPDDVIWVHDYHLIPLAKVLRDRGHKNRIGFFIHVPFPPPEILTALPNHDRLIPALCHYDVVGFQTEIDAANFCRYVANECGLPWAKGNSFHFGNRIVQVGTFPVGVESEAFSRLARRAVESTFVREVLDSLSGRAMIIGVDRLDYTKGLPERMDAFESFLGKFPDWRGKVTYLQITQKSRSEIREYMEIDEAVGSAAGRINGTYGEASWTPIRYVNRAHSRTALAGLYRAARAALVTPLRDGMNLVAKEFVASQDPENPGVLVLSCFAGAASELTAALIVNPFDSMEITEAMQRGLVMSLEERQERWRSMFATVRRNDIGRWRDSFMRALGDVAG